MPNGYCKIEDVRKVLQEKELTGELSGEFILSAIVGQTEWVQETTNRHWFDPNQEAYGGDYGDIYGDSPPLPAEPLVHANDELSIPSTKHAGNQQMQVAAAKQAAYPVRHSGPYTRVKLTRRDVRQITALNVRNNSGGQDDWVADNTEGRGEDYYLQVNSHDGFSYLYLHTRSLPRLPGYGNAVLATYEYGIEGVSNTVRRAVALKAAAQLVLDDDAQIGIPDSGQLVSLESKAQAMERQAEELLDIHM